MNATLRQVVRKAIRLRHRFKRTPFGIRVIAWPKIPAVNFLYSLSGVLTKLSGKPVALTGVPPRFGPEPTEFEHEISIFLRAYNEASYLDEFICFHLALGVDHIYIYDNNSQDNTSDVLAKYVEKGVVTHVVWPAKPPSPTADIDCVLRCREKSRWLMCIDTDEFLFPLQADSLPEALERYKKQPAVHVANLFFGSSHLETRPDGLVIENFHWCGENLSGATKTIVNPRKAIKVGSSHYWWLKGWNQGVQEDFKPTWAGASLEPVSKVFRLNHYYAKSLEEYMMKVDPSYFVDFFGKISQTRVASNAPKAFTENNDVEHHDIDRFIPRVHEKMKEFGVVPYKRSAEPENSKDPAPTTEP